MLGKRARAHMRRTTSMTGITVDPMEAPPPLDLLLHNPTVDDHAHVVMVGPTPALTDYDPQRLTAVLSPRYHRMMDFSDHLHGGLGSSSSTANFLGFCGLCSRRLPPGRDIYMYRGDTAFCSEECREQRMNQEERKEKRKMQGGGGDGGGGRGGGVSNKVGSRHAQYSELNAPDSSTNSETIAAA